MSSKPLFIAFFLLLLTIAKTYGQNPQIKKDLPTGQGSLFQPANSIKGSGAPSVWDITGPIGGSRDIVKNVEVQDKTYFKYSNVQGCEVNPFDAIALDFKLLVGSNCNVSETNYCQCLIDHSKNNVIAKSAKESVEKNKAEKLQKLKQEYKEKILSVYTQINYGSSIQEQTYRIPSASSEPNKVAGCTSNDLGAAFTEADLEINTKSTISSTDEYISAKLKKPLDNCGNDCGSVKAEIHKNYLAIRGQGQFNGCLRTAYAYDNKNSKKTENSSTGKNEKKSAFHMVSQKNKEQDLISKVHLNITDVSNVDIDNPNFRKGEFSNKKWLVSQLNLFSEFFARDPGFASPEASKMLASVGRNGNRINREDFCYLLEEYSFKLNSGTVPAAARPLSESGSEIKDELDNRNMLAKKLIDQSYNNDRILTGSCISYNDFKVINATPSADLLKDLNLNSSVDFFNPASLHTGQQERIRFLRNNPLLAKIAGDANGRAALARELVKFAKDMKDKSPAAIHKAYFEFMNTKVPKLRANSDIKDVHQCQLLGETLATIESATSLPPFPLTAENGDPAVLANNYLACYVKFEDKGSRASPLSKITENPLYLILGDGSSNGEVILGPDTDEDYKQYVKDKCQSKGYDKFVTDNCSDVTKCDLKEVAKAFNKKNNPELERIVRIVHRKTKIPDANVAAQVTDERFQNTAAKNYYLNQVAPNLKKYASKGSSQMSEQGHQAAVEDLITSAQKSFENSQVPNTSVSRSVASVVDNQLAMPTHQSDPTAQIQPRWLPEQGKEIEEYTLLNPASKFSDFVSKDETDSNLEIKEEMKDVKRRIAETFSEMKKVAKAQDDKTKLDQIVKAEKRLLQEGNVFEANISKSAGNNDFVNNPQGMGGGGNVTSNTNQGGAFNYSNSPSVTRKMAIQKSGEGLNRAMLAMYSEEGLKLTLMKDAPSEAELNKFSAGSQTVPMSPTEAEYSELMSSPDGLTTYLFKNLKPLRETQILIREPASVKYPEGRTMKVVIVLENGEYKAKVQRVSKLSVLRNQF